MIIVVVINYIIIASIVRMSSSRPSFMALQQELHPLHPHSNAQSNFDIDKSNNDSDE